MFSSVFICCSLLSSLVKKTPDRYGTASIHRGAQEAVRQFHHVHANRRGSGHSNTGTILLQGFAHLIEYFVRKMRHFTSPSYLGIGRLEERNSGGDLDFL